MNTLITIGWVIVTLLYVATHHLYNWATRKIGIKENDLFIIQFIIFLVYVALNAAYFVFTYHVFKII